MALEFVKDLLLGGSIVCAGILAGLVADEGHRNIIKIYAKAFNALLTA